LLFAAAAIAGAALVSKLEAGKYNRLLANFKARQKRRDG